MLELFIQYLALVFSVPLQIALGRTVRRYLTLALGRFIVVEPQNADRLQWLCAEFTLGLFLHTLCVFYLKCAGLFWMMAVLIPLLLAIPSVGEVLRDLRSLPIRFSWNFVLWFSVVLFIGISLLDVSDLISTIWVNNYGDITWHLGMTTSFVFGENFPPEYHIFPGTALSYPFLVNLWTAMLWFWNPDFQALPLIFVFQWVTAWVVAYVALRGDRWRLAPWAILFGGGSYMLSYYLLSASPESQYFAKLPHQFLDKGFPWAPFLGTIWVTQRPAIMGIAGLSIALSLFHSFLAFTRERKTNGLGAVLNQELLISVLIVALMPLVHTHFFVIAAGYFGILICLPFLRTLRRSFNPELSWFELTPALRRSATDVAVFYISLSVSLASVPWLLGKTSILRFIAGWNPWPKPIDGEIISSIVNSAAMWGNNAAPWLILCLLLAIISRRWLELTAIALLFCIFNTVLLAVWEWDQLKLFLGLYVVSISLLTTLCPRRFWLFQFYMVLLCIPSIYHSLADTIISYQDLVVYTKEDIERAQTVRGATEPSAVILAAPWHNSLVTLTGRRMFMGYDGTLHSHALPYQRHRALVENISEGLQCNQREELGEDAPILCPDYLLYGKAEELRWKKEDIDPSHLRPWVGDFLFRIDSSD